MYYGATLRGVPFINPIHSSPQRSDRPGPVRPGPIDTPCFYSRMVAFYYIPGHPDPSNNSAASPGQGREGKGREGRGMHKLHAISESLFVARRKYDRCRKCVTARPFLIHARKTAPSALGDFLRTPRSQSCSRPAGSSSACKSGCLVPCASPPKTQKTLHALRLCQYLGNGLRYDDTVCFMMESKKCNVA